LGKKTGSKAEGKKAEELENPGDARWEELHKRVIEHVSDTPSSYHSMIDG
jgi:26S proteasome regulatory subunit N5